MIKVLHRRRINPKNLYQSNQHNSYKSHRNLHRDSHQYSHRYMLVFAVSIELFSQLPFQQLLMNFQDYNIYLIWKYSKMDQINITQ